jgi:hypothetical protein
MASKKDLRKLKPRGRKARFAEYARRTKTAVGQWSKGRFHSDHLDKALREWSPDAATVATPPATAICGIVEIGTEPKLIGRERQKRQIDHVDATPKIEQVA